MLSRKYAITHKIEMKDSRIMLEVPKVILASAKFIKGSILLISMVKTKIPENLMKTWTKLM
jgi:hypothetical protein